MGSQLKKVWLCLVVSLFQVSAYADPGLRVGVASGSPLKLQVVREVFQEVFPGRKLELLGYSASSGVAEQPVGAASGTLGAQNRLMEARQKHLGHGMDYWVSIENFVEKSDIRSLGPVIHGNSQWIDQAAVLVQNGMSDPVIEYSKKVPFEEKYALRAQAQTAADYPLISTGYSTTCGKMIQEEFAQRGEVIAHDNWQGHDQFGGVSRVQLLREALLRGILKAEIRAYPNFPKKGVLFQDMMPLFRKPDLLRLVVKQLAAQYEEKNIEAIVGLESRGFLLGVPLALEMNVPFIPLRKKGKLPRPTHSQVYQTEYSRDEIEIDAEDLQGKTVLMVDDLLATGGTLEAAENLLSQAGVSQIHSTCLIELSHLKGRGRLKSSFFSLFQYSM